MKLQQRSFHQKGLFLHLAGSSPPGEDGAPEVPNTPRPPRTGSDEPPELPPPRTRHQRGSLQEGRAAEMSPGSRRRALALQRSRSQETPGGGGGGGVSPRALNPRDGEFMFTSTEFIAPRRPEVDPSGRPMRRSFSGSRPFSLAEYPMGMFQLGPPPFPAHLNPAQIGYMYYNGRMYLLHPGLPPRFGGPGPGGPRPRGSGPGSLRGAPPGLGYRAWLARVDEPPATRPTPGGATTGGGNQAEATDSSNSSG